MEYLNGKKQTRIKIMIETLDDILDELANKIGVYESQYSEEDRNDVHGHPPDCICRVCFLIEYKERIETAIRIENALTKTFLKQK